MSFPDLSKVPVDIAAAHGVSRMELWNYLPMEDHEDVRGLIAPLADMMPSLRAALDRYALESHRRGLRIVPAALGDRAGAVGAGLLAWEAEGSAG